MIAATATARSADDGAGGLVSFKTSLLSLNLEPSTVALRKKSAIVRRIEARLEASDDPLHVRVFVGRVQVGFDAPGGRYVVWSDVEMLSPVLLARGYGRVVEDDGIPF